jgi:hypothetical protein
VSTIATQVGRALSQAHAEGVFHRDLKPANVFLMRDEEGRLLVKLLDFGIARVTHAHRTSRPPHATHATARGVVFGTPSYMSPEQARGSARLDQRCDLWALATILYECASGELPVEGTNTDRVLQNLCAGRIIRIRLRSPGIPQSLDGFFVRAFAEEVGDRFATAAELVQAFQEAVGTSAVLQGGGDPEDAIDTLVVDSAHGSVLDRNAHARALHVAAASGAQRAGRAAVKVLAGVSILLLLAAGVAARTLLARPAAAPPSPASPAPSPSSLHADRTPAESAAPVDPVATPASPESSRSARDPAIGVPVTALPRSKPRPAQGGAGVRGRSPNPLPQHPGRRAWKRSPGPPTRAKCSETQSTSTRSRPGRTMPPSVKSWSLLAFAVAGAAAASTLAAAREARADPMADAKDLFTRGRELRTHGDCANAVAMFRKAYDLYPAALGSLRNLAECQESLGRYASARRAWVDLKRALLTNADRKYEGWDRDAEQAAGRLAPMLATLAIDVVVVTPRGEAVSPDAIEVTLDGEKLAQAQLGTPLERDPGRHVVRIAGERVAQPQERALDLASGNAERLSFRVVVRDRAEQPATLPPASTPGPSPGAERADTAALAGRHDAKRETGSDGKRTWGWIALSVGAAGVAGAGISLAVRQAALADLNHECASHQGCLPTVASTVSRGQTASTLVSVFAILGGVGLAGGIVLLATSGGHSSAVASLIVVPGGGGVGAAGSF